ncbi:MAG: translation initiation factor IF-2 [Bacteroidia bacterium]|nr:translation initiation factor IF-2 [Bacteroidia bacterium]
MSETLKVHRLSKIAKELNVSTSTIIDFLKGKKYDIENNPNAKISDDIYTVLLGEFRSEKEIKEESKKVTLPKIKKEDVTLEGNTRVGNKKLSDQEDIVIKNIHGASSDTEIFKPKADKEVSVKIVSKIDLDALSPKAKTEEPVKEEKKGKGNKKAVSEAPVEAPAEPPVEKKEDFFETKVQKLEGPTIVGKIDLPVAEEKKKQPIASSAGGSLENDKKKKRKRIRKGLTEGEIGNIAASGDKSKFSPGTARGRGRGREPKVALTEDEVQKQIKETLARLSNQGSKSKTSKYRKLKREEIREQMEEDAMKQAEEKKVLKVTEFVSASQLASMINVPVNEIIQTCMSLGMFVSINQRLDAEAIAIVAEEFGYKVEFVSVEVVEAIKTEEDAPEDLFPRSPIVTVMGHVDHGKTSLLDYIRKANVIAGEAGGITQHIGAYSVELENGKHITFLDTPGHEAFTAMRARGAQATDLAIIVIAADDSVMPQTREAINHAQAAGVPIVIAINKIDKPGANPNKIREDLSQMNILVEEWGGKVQCQEISAKKGTAVDLLLEKVLLEAEMLDLKANPKKRAQGIVIEASLDKGKGYVATMLVSSGTMHVGDVILAGCYSGRVKAMHNERGVPIEAAGPASPVMVLGLTGAPQAGDKFNVMDDEREARDIATKRLQLQREQGIRTQKHITLDEIGRRLAIGDFKELNIILKGDVDGSIEALSDSLQKLSTEKIQTKIILKGVGAITESDVLLASASNAIIIGFQVRPSAGARKLAEQEQIDVRLYSIIYDAINEVKDAMEGMLAPEYQEKITCNVEVRDVFNITKVGTVAGCMVIDGKIGRNTKVRLIRDGIVVHSGSLGSLKRFKDDAKEVATGFECGLNIENFNDIKVGDIIEGYEQVEVKAKL